MTEVRAYVNRKFGGKNRDINLLMARDERWVTSRSRRVGKRLSVDWRTLRVHDVEKNLALIFFIVTTSILVSK